MHPKHDFQSDLNLKKDQPNNNIKKSQKSLSHSSIHLMEKRKRRGKIYSHLYKTAQPASKDPEVPAPYKYKFQRPGKYPLQSRQTNSNGD